jgi:uncharacterized DUF497 family protein
MEFEWDPKKADSNKRKHGVTFQEGTGDPLAITFADPDHSEDEERNITFGLSTQKTAARCLTCAPWKQDKDYQCASYDPQGKENL